ncbi:GGDEF domain-containing protein [Glaciimonas sp. PCH181]|uniref:GGDEF domain-containing protein n=1 Tax=Glaciimonas sp. PCH181 TaxID=2133943 RepID=UPI000D3B3B52|nr:GGDEF domain-containing protein [Glaciimonas sp. PCH181]PUA16406.1 hypothetical protein C7W93_24145 [Glaciimonas sp. PCH181]
MKFPFPSFRAQPSSVESMDVAAVTESAVFDAPPVISVVNGGLSESIMTAPLFPQLQQLQRLLRELSEGNGDRQSLQRACELMLSTTPELRLVWVGFFPAEGHDDNENVSGDILPNVVLGAALPEAAAWLLPRDSFDFIAPYTQIVDWQESQEHEFHALFSPWKNTQQQCSVTNALAIPLCVENASVYGMAVFYADDAAYFKETGLATFQAFGHVCEVVWKQSHLAQLLRQQARVDHLTGCLNRERIAREFELSAAAAQKIDPASPLSIIYCCLQDFGKLSALYGWVAADNMLAAFARATCAQLRPQDKGGRWSSTEFLYVLPGADADLAEDLMKSFLGHFKQSPVIADDWSIRIGFSIGAATYGVDGNGLDELLHYVSQNMRNSIAPTVVYDSPAYKDVARWRTSAKALNDLSGGQRSPNEMN